jgi:hypothetical protein
MVPTVFCAEGYSLDGLGGCLPEGEVGVGRPSGGRQRQAAAPNSSSYDSAHPMVPGSFAPKTQEGLGGRRIYVLLTVNVLVRLPKDPLGPGEYLKLPAGSVLPSWAATATFVPTKGYQVTVHRLLHLPPKGPAFMFVVAGSVMTAAASDPNVAYYAPFFRVRDSAYPCPPNHERTLAGKCAMMAFSNSSVPLETSWPSACPDGYALDNQGDCSPVVSGGRPSKSLLVAVGDNTSAVAARAGVSVESLVAANPELPRVVVGDRAVFAVLREGMSLNLPLDRRGHG